MNDDERSVRLLEEIRDATRDHLAEYRRVTQQSLDMQERALARQLEVAALYKRIVRLSGTLVFVLLVLLVYLLVKWGPRLFFR